MSRSSSLFGLATMILGIMAVTLASTLVLTGWALRNSFDAIGRAVILDDLGEYEVLYASGGVTGIKALFTAGEHDKDQLVQIIDPTGRPILDMEGHVKGGSTLSSSHFTPLEVGQTDWERVTLEDGTLLTLGRKKLADGAELRFGRTDVADQEAISGVHRIMWLAAGFTTLLAAGPVIWFAHRVLRPVRDLISSARQLAGESSLNTRLTPADSIPELTEFASAFNASLDRVQQLTEELEAANDQLAHELRTPLARIRSNLEAMLREPEKYNTQEVAAHAVDEVDRAARLIQSILSIRAGDSRTMKLHLQLTSVCELVTEVCELYSAAAEERNLSLELLVTGGDRQLLLDRERMQQALTNYLDNALSYTPGPGEITVLLDVEDSEVFIRVQDTGPGITEADQQRIWRRFVRGSASSARTPGIGLGLSLVSAVAHAHHGEAGCTNRPEGGSEFWIRLPIAGNPV